MGIEIAISVAREETRVAVLDGGVVTDLFGDRAKHKDFVGNVYKGKVAKVLPGMHRIRPRSVCSHQSEPCRPQIGHGFSSLVPWRVALALLPVVIRLRQSAATCPLPLR